MRYILIILLFFVCKLGTAQVYQLMPQYGYDAKRFNFDSTLSIPTTCGVPTLKSNVLKKSAIAYDSCNKRFYYYDPKLLAWDTIKGGGASIDTTYLSNRIDSKLSIVDTSVLLRKIDTLYLSNRINGRLLIQDTSAFLRKADTTTLSQNFFNTNLRATDDRYHFFKNYNLSIDSMQSYTFKATSPVQINRGSIIYGDQDQTTLRTLGRLPLNNTQLTIDSSKATFYFPNNKSYIMPKTSPQPYEIVGYTANNQLGFVYRIDSLKKSNDSIFFSKNGTWTFSFKDSIGSTSGFIPYVGATQDVDLGTYKISSASVYVTGTNGNGHIHLKHQNGDATATGQSTSLYANNQGYLKWKNDGLYYSTLATPQTADRVFTFQNKSYTIGDSADISAKLNSSDSTIYQTKFRSDTARTNTYTALGLKMNQSDSVTYQTKFRTDSMRTNIYTALGLELNISDSNTTYQTKFRSDTARTNIYTAIRGRDIDFINIMNTYYGTSYKAKTLSIEFMNASSSLSLSNSLQYFYPFFLQNADTIKSISFFNRATGNFTGNNYNGIGLYSFSNGTLTLIDSTINDQNIWKGTINTWSTANFVNKPLSQRGMYYVAFLWNASASTTAPNIAMTPQVTTANFAGLTMATNKVFGNISSRTTLISSQAMSGVTGGQQLAFFLIQ